jgi:hypothetical protein
MDPRAAGRKSDETKSTRREEAAEQIGQMCGEGDLEKALKELVRFAEGFVLVLGAVAPDGDCSLGPRSTEDGVHADVSRSVFGELRREAGC